MGLDQYLYKVKTNMSTKEFMERRDKLDLDEWGFLNEKQFDELCNSVNMEEIDYWRKSYDLDKYLTNLYYEKGGTKEFNCKYLDLTADDISNVIKHFKDDESIVASMEKALIQINKGYRIWYENWW